VGLSSWQSSSDFEGRKNGSSHFHLYPELRILPAGAGPFQSNMLLRLNVGSAEVNFKLASIGH